MGRPIKHEQELGTEQSMELYCAGTRAKSSPTSAPLLSTTHSHSDYGLRNTLEVPGSGPGVGWKSEAL